MKNEINANLLAQMALDQIEEMEVTNVINDLIQSMPLPDYNTPDSHQTDYDRLYAANRLTKATKAVYDKLRSVIINLLKEQNPKDAVTIQLGTRMFKFYYTRSYTWENLHLKEREDETPAERQLREQAEPLLKKYNDASEKIAELERELRKYKRDKSSAEENLADLLPNSKCIKRTPVLQIA